MRLKTVFKVEGLIILFFIENKSSNSLFSALDITFINTFFKSSSKRISRVPAYVFVVCPSVKPSKLFLVIDLVTVIIFFSKSISSDYKASISPTRNPVFMAIRKIYLYFSFSKAATNF